MSRLRGTSACSELSSSDPIKESKDFVTVRSGTLWPNPYITEEETKAFRRACDLHSYYASEPEHKAGSLLRALSSSCLAVPHLPKQALPL